MPAMMKEKNAKPHRPMLPRGLFQHWATGVAVTGGGTSLRISSFSSSEDESRRRDALATRLDISFSVLPDVLKLSSYDSGGGDSGSL